LLHQQGASDIDADHDEALTGRQRQSHGQYTRMITTSCWL